MWAEKRPHEWLEGVSGVLGLAPSAHISQINQKVIKEYILLRSRNYETRKIANVHIFLTKSLQMFVFDKIKIER
jgi:hypothetical protein